MSFNDDHPHNRRVAIRKIAATATAVVSAPALLIQSPQHHCGAAESTSSPAINATSSLESMVGITCGGGLGRQRERGELDLFSVPKYVHEELGMRLIDLNTRWTTPYSEKELAKARETAERTGCYFSNLKVNYNVGNMYSDDAAERRQAVQEARSQVDAAKTLGTRWIRFTIPQQHADAPVAHIELAQYAHEQGLKLLVENGGWMKSHPGAISSVVKAIGGYAAACPDTGNWDDDLRAEGLRKSFVGAESCDFKVFELGKNHQHAEYDLKQCFDLGWNAGFRGPWIIEHMKDATENFARDTVYIRELLQKWIAKRNG
tara:strand:- start:23282 stop:24232 length:951 start_codon:yes stop_codon:yes gene_type:complete